MVSIRKPQPVQVDRGAVEGVSGVRLNGYAGRGHALPPLVEHTDAGSPRAWSEDRPIETGRKIG